MKVILLQDIKRFGQKGQVVEVADGYANSFLIPKKMARVASGGDVQHYQTVSQAKQQKIEKKQSEQENLFKKYNKKKITIAANVNQSGKLFKSITIGDITAQLPGLHAEHLKMKHGIKELGEHQISYHIGNLKGYITVSVTRS